MKISTHGALHISLKILDKKEIRAKNTNAICYSWPTLQTELINSKSEALDLWKTILCISTSSK